MTRTSDGITSLLAAEKKAVDKIEEAKRNKLRRLKAAKDDADKEVEVLQRAQEAEFRKTQSAHAGSKDAMTQKVDLETATRLQSMESDVSSHKERIIKRILDMVYEITPQMHQNARFEEQEEPEEKVFRKKERREEPMFEEQEEKTFEEEEEEDEE